MSARRRCLNADVMRLILIALAYDCYSSLTELELVGHKIACGLGQQVFYA